MITDPFSITAGVVDISDTVTRLSSAMYRLKDNSKTADTQFDLVRQHALLLKGKIESWIRKKRRIFVRLNNQLRARIASVALPGVIT